MSIAIIRNACIEDTKRILEIYVYYVKYTAVTFETNVATSHEF